MRRRIHECFYDPVVVQKSQKIAARRKASKDAAETIEEVEKIMSNKNSSNNQLKNILRESPFVLIRRECRHSLMLIKSRDQIPRGIEDLQGSRCPTCNELVEAVDVIVLQ